MSKGLAVVVHRDESRQLSELALIFGGCIWVGIPAVLRVKLGRLDEWNERRRERAERYRTGLAEIPDIISPLCPEEIEPIWHQFVIGVPDRDAVRTQLSERGVETLVHYWPLPHLTPAYRGDGWSEGAFPRAEHLASRAISLPIYPQLTIESCDTVVSELIRCKRADS